MVRKFLLLILLISTYQFPQALNSVLIKSMVDSVNQNNIKNHIVNLAYAGGHNSRVNLTPGNDSGVVYIFNYLRNLPNLEVKIDTFYITDATPPYNQKPVYNVIATTKYRTSSNKYFLIGAHHDCSASRMGSSIWQSQWKTIIAPGADDNATGVASMLEIARIISSYDFSNIDYNIQLVAFGAEESGNVYPGHHYGSIHLANKSKAQGDTLLGMISVDMIGFNDKNIMFNSVVTNNDSREIFTKLKNANLANQIGLILIESVNSTATYSDHQSYWDAGFKAALLIEYAPPWSSGIYYNANPYYHKTSDTLGTVNLPLVRRIAQVTLAAGLSYMVKPTDVDDDLYIVRDFALFQNYPNPFNGSTVIRFNMNEDGEVKLSIYNNLGQIVNDNYNFNASKGINDIKLDFSNLSSGIYFYKLEHNGTSLTKKMILMK